MPTITVINRREALRLVAATLASNAAMEAFGQKPSHQLPATETITVGGITMQITETTEEGGYVVHVTFIKQNKKIFDARTKLTRLPIETQITQILTAAEHGFTYQIEVYAKQASGQPDPEVFFNVSIQQAPGQKKQEFSGRIGSSSNEDGVKYPPPIDKVLPPPVQEQLSVFNDSINKKNHALEQSTDIHVSPAKDEHPHIWYERNCHALCQGISGLGAVIVCAGTAGIGCGIAQIGFFMTASYCSDSCPK